MDHPQQGDAAERVLWCPVVVLTDGMPTTQTGAADRAPERADALAACLLGASRTELGGQQINHARRVATRVRRTANGRVVAAALLHEVVASRRITVDELRAAVADDRLADLVEVLTRLENETDEHYLARCAADPLALVVKRADLADNLIADDSNVPAATGLRIRRQASRQLALLNLLAHRHAH
jgi:(p)ppGpp synthase/HD superfamily hydrolase